MPSTRQACPVDTAEFRKLMSAFATGVCVVSIARDNDTSQDAPISGMTINSLVSVSLEPTLICWSLHNDSSQFKDYADAEKFAVSILAADQQDLARRYAARGDSALSRADFVLSERGLPLIGGALATIECRRWATYPAGDHTMILGEVMALDTVSTEGQSAALGFLGGRFRTFEI